MISSEQTGRRSDKVSCRTLETCRWLPLAIRGEGLSRRMRRWQSSSSAKSLRDRAAAYSSFPPCNPRRASHLPPLAFLPLSAVSTTPALARSASKARSFSSSSARSRATLARSSDRSTSTFLNCSRRLSWSCFRFSRSCLISSSWSSAWATAAAPDGHLADVLGLAVEQLLELLDLLFLLGHDAVGDLDRPFDGHLVGRLLLVAGVEIGIELGQQVLLHRLPVGARRRGRGPPLWRALESWSDSSAFFVFSSRTSCTAISNRRRRSSSS